MRQGDLVMVNMSLVSPPEAAKPAIVMNVITGGAFVQVFLDGKIQWIATCYVVEGENETG